jgi:hypothetical protein
LTTVLDWVSELGTTGQWISWPTSLSFPNSSEFFNWAESIKIGRVISSARQLLYADQKDLGISISSSLENFSKRKQANLTRYLIHLFGKEYLMKAFDC